VRAKTARKALWVVDLAQSYRLLEERNAKTQRRKDAKVVDLAKIKKLSGDFPCSMVGCAAKPASPTLRKTSKPLGSPSPPGLWLGE
jgi:hypothetical protein